MPSRTVRHCVVALFIPFPVFVSAQQLSPADRQLIVVKLWAEARANYAYWDRVHADWDSALTADLALAQGRATDRQFFRALRRLLALLGDGESDVRAPGAVQARVARPPIELRAVERRPFIIDYAPNDEMRIARPERLADPDIVRLFDHAFPDFANVTGMILDLREHGGGSGGREAGYQILARLTDRPFLTSRWRTPQYRPAYRGQDMPDSAGAWFTAPPDTIRPRSDRPRFKGPVAVLSSPRTSGPAADLLVAFRNAARGPILGEPSAGSTGQVLAIPLAKGWGVQLCVTRDAFPDGSEFAGFGVAPELPVVVTVEDFLAGRDVALDRAREYISGNRR